MDTTIVCWGYIGNNGMKKMKTTVVHRGCIGNNGNGMKKREATNFLQPPAWKLLRLSVSRLGCC